MEKMNEEDYSVDATTPKSLNHPCHSHPLMLTNENRYGFICDLCKKDGSARTWLYLCKACDYGGHINCFALRTESTTTTDFNASDRFEQASRLNELHLLQQQQEQLMAVRMVAQLEARGRRAALELLDDNPKTKVVITRTRWNADDLI